MGGESAEQWRREVRSVEKVQSADGTQIAFERSGEGPPLVLVQGAFNDRTSSVDLAGQLGADFTVYAFDRRGRGDSDQGGAYAVEREVEDLAAVLDAAALRAAGAPAAVYGHSSGACLAAEAAARGVPMQALALYEPPYGTGASLEFAAELTALAAAGQASVVAEKFLRITGVSLQALEQMKQAPYWPRMTSFAGTLPYDVTLASRPLPAGLAGAGFPVLALAGGASPDWAGAAAKAIAAAAPAGRSQLLADQTHNVAPGLLAPVLTEFFLSAPA
jgi:pimeloyl-ACP methyl ester carboxylesterase